MKNVNINVVRLRLFFVHEYFGMCVFGARMVCMCVCVHMFLCVCVCVCVWHVCFNV